VPFPVPGGLRGFTGNTVYPAAINAAAHGPRSVSIPIITSESSAPSGTNRPISSCSRVIPSAPSGSRFLASTLPASSITSMSHVLRPVIPGEQPHRISLSNIESLQQPAGEPSAT
jgi:hypothetical protein